MKKIINLLIIAIMCVTMAVPAFAADFVPSITYKDGPDLNNATMNGTTVTSALVITTISEAKNKTTNITQEERDMLLDLYKKLDSGEMKLPISNQDFVIRELVDISYSASSDGSQEEWLKTDGNTITVTLDLGIKSAHDLAVLVYVDGQWVEAEKIVSKGNGIFAITFEELGPVAICVDSDAQVSPPKTGDDNGSAMLLWGGVLLGSVVAVVVLVILFKRSKKEEE